MPLRLRAPSSVEKTEHELASTEHCGNPRLEDNTKWKSTNGQTCESIYTSKNKKSHCKQANKHGVTGNDACQCSC